MALDSIPPWLNIGPSMFTQALEAGARTGLALTEASQRAQQLAEARAEREAQMQERQAQEAERQREFEASHLLNVQKVAQDAAQLQQQIAHQTALEASQRAQESRLLNYQTGRLGVEQQRANLAAQQAATPTTWVPPTAGAPGYFNTARGVKIPPESAMGGAALDVTTKELLDPTTGKRLGVISREGPRSQRFTPDAALSPAQTVGAYNAQISDILKEMDSLDMLAAARNPDHPKHARYEELQRELDEARKSRSALIPASSAKVPTVLAPMANAARIRVRRKSDGKVFTYPGVAEDVPKDRYEVLP